MFLIAWSMQSVLYTQLTFLGAAANYGTWIKEPGASIYAIYSVNEKIDIVPNATYFLPHTFDVTDGTHEYTWWHINLDGHYVVFEPSGIQLFGLMGLCFTNETKRIDELIQGQQPYRDKINATKIGLNIGAGGQLHLAKYFNPFAEVKYSLGDRHQFVFTLGILCRIASDRVPGESDEF
ncbi:MAG: hypothetical protein AMS27_05955 [Bacteroides sp. SM23_62_1]|nr:MAG: hypothetical protein AMS27_05955 [Bacteroides sp. SM23_62_1]